MPPSLSKSELRRDALKKRAAVAPADHAAWSRAVSERLFTLIHGLARHPHTVAGYFPLRGETDILHALSLLHAARHVTALPVVAPSHRPLAFHRWAPGDALVKGAYAIGEPHVTAESIVIPDAVIVPLLAFDRSGRRLGYGQGHYDATLRRLRADNPSLLAVGAAFALQEVAALPADAHDERLDAIVTQQEVIKLEDNGFTG